MVTDDALPAEPAIPEGIREPFAVLKVEVTRLHYRWKVLKQFYSETRRVELLNTVASDFFGLDQEIWQDAILLGISRVLDPNRDATSLRQLVRLASTKVRHDVVPKLEKRLDRLAATMRLS